MTELVQHWGEVDCSRLTSSSAQSRLFALNMVLYCKGQSIERILSVLDSIVPFPDPGWLAKKKVRRVDWEPGDYQPENGFWLWKEIKTEFTLAGECIPIPALPRTESHLRLLAQLMAHSGLSPLTCRTICPLLAALQTDRVPPLVT